MWRPLHDAPRALPGTGSASLAARMSPLSRVESGWHLRPARVLVVDDEPVIAQTMGLLLGDEHQVQTEVRAADALGRLRAGMRFDVMLCDVMMPEMTGLDLLDAIEREMPEQASAMLFMSGGVFDARLRARLEASGRPCIDKPIELSRVYSFITERAGAAGRLASAASLR
jgi:CheY-like chemotaxis protein